MVGEVVLIEVDNKKRKDWPVGIIKNVIPGKDGKCRVLQLKTAYGNLIRPIQRVYPLEINHFGIHSEKKKIINSQEKKKGDTDKCKTTPYTEVKCGRKIKLPERYK